MASFAGNPVFINTATTTQVKSDSGILKKVIIGDKGTTWVVKIYDATSGTTNEIFEFVSTAEQEFVVEASFHTGLRVITSGTPGNVTIVYE